MKFGAKKTILGVLGMAAACLLGAALGAGGQGAPAQKPLLAEDAFKNVQVLKGIPVNQFMEAMGFFSASLGQSCEYCHEMPTGTWQDYAIDNAHKKMARKMILMMNAINQTNFAGRRVVTCYTCHNGGEQPKVTPTLAGVYAAPPPDDPDETPLGQAPAGITADQVLDKYLQALGGTQRLEGLTSFIAKGTNVGYGDQAYERPVEIFAKAPDQRATVIHTVTGDNTTTYDGRTGWVAAPETNAPVPVMALTGTDLDGARLDAMLSFPAQIKQAPGGWRAGAPATIDNREVQVLQGTAGGHPVRLFFDKESGLLVRLLRYTDSSVGLNPTQIDYSDYREVAGVKTPFKWTVTWLDGTSAFTLSDVQANAAIAAAKFAKPAPPTAPSKPATP
jgi:outer membrane lipoprotein-sorting protein